MSFIKQLNAGRPSSLIISICLFLVVIILLVYWGVGNYPFIFDDEIYISLNPQVKNGLSVENIKWAFGLHHGEKTYWHPLTWISHMLDVQLFGIDPGWHHLTNVFIHTLNSALLFLFVYLATGTVWQSALVATLFAIHPINVESVAWIAERKNVLSSFFVLLSMIAYIFYARHPSAGKYGLVAILFTLGLTAKPMLVTFPLILLLLDYWPLQRMSLPVNSPPVPGTRDSRSLHPPKQALSFLLLEKTPLAMLSVWAVSLSTLALQHHNNFHPLTQQDTLSLRVANAFVSYAGYIYKMIVPLNLAVFYPYPDNIPTWQSGGAALLLSAVTVLFVVKAKKSPWLPTGWFWFLITLLPVSGLVKAGLWPALADRWAYIPLIGLYIIIAWSVSGLVDRFPHQKTGILFLVGLLLASCISLSWKQKQYWADGVSLFGHSLEITKPSETIYTNYAVAFLKHGEYTKGLEVYSRYLEINGRSADAHAGKGSILINMGHYEEAAAHFAAVLQINPGYNNIHSLLGGALDKSGRSKAAAAHFRAALLREPDNATMHYNLASVLEKTGEQALALQHYSEAIRLKPDYTAAHNNIGVLLAEQNRLNEAISHFEKALTISPNDAQAKNNLEQALRLERNISDKSIEQNVTE